MRFLTAFAALLLAVPMAAVAAPEDDLRILRADAVAIPGAVVTEYPDFTIVEDRARMAIHYFTKPSHYAHPAAVMRFIVEQGGDISVSYAVWPYESSDVAPASFRRWMDEFRDLDRQMREDIERRLGGRR